METQIEKLVRLAGIGKGSSAKLRQAGTAEIFDAGNVEEMKKTLDRYKAATGDHSPSHIFELGDELWVATRVVKD